MSKRSRALRYYRSYKPQGPIKKSVRFFIKLIVIVFLLYMLVGTFLFNSYQISSTHGSSTQDSGEQPVYAGRVLATPILYGPKVHIINYRVPAIRTPKRGALVITETDTSPEMRWYTLTLNTLAKFFTFNNFIPFEENEFTNVSRFQIMRVVGMPGDEVKLDNYRLKVKTPTSNYFIDEQEVIQANYTLIVPPLDSPSQGTQGLSGNHPAIALSGGEYLLAPDDRTHFSLSKYWRPTKMKDIISKALLVYWPRFQFL